MVVAHSDGLLVEYSAMDLSIISDFKLNHRTFTRDFWRVSAKPAKIKKKIDENKKNRHTGMPLEIDFNDWLLPNDKHCMQKFQRLMISMTDFYDEIQFLAYLKFFLAKIRSLLNSMIYIEFNDRRINTVIIT